MPSSSRRRARSCATSTRSTATPTFLFDKINFLMNATVGFININQNKIIKIFSVASVALLPPTLIASIYGMNFKAMPELDWTLRLSVRDRADGRLGGGAVHLLPPQGLAAIARAPRPGHRPARRRRPTADVVGSGRRVPRSFRGKAATGRPGHVQVSLSAPGGTREEGGRRRTPRGFQPARPAGSATKTGSTCRPAAAPVSRKQQGAASNRYDAARAESSPLFRKTRGLALPAASSRPRTPAGRGFRRTAGRSASGAAWSRRATTLAPLQGRRCSIPNSSSSSKPCAGTWTSDIPWDQFDASQADRGAGADGQDERHHRVGGVAGDRDVPARQPRRQRLLAPS